MLKKSLSQGVLACAGTPFFVALACQGKTGILNAFKQSMENVRRFSPNTQ
jgi:hypothetical protein